MNSEKVKQMLDSFYMAKRILDLLPQLTQGVLPSYIRYLEAIIELEQQNKKVKISDVSDYLNLPRPGVTRTIHTMEEKGFLKKIAAKHDGRITYITVTSKGQYIFEKFNQEYFSDLAKSLDFLNEKDIDCTIKTINEFYKVMNERGRK